MPQPDPQSSPSQQTVPPSTRPSAPRSTRPATRPSPSPSAQATAPAPALRRAPVQQRSAERLARIVDACAELLDETGYEQLSTRAVAARAGVPIGSVYRFFGNKRALATALAHRNLDRYAARIAARLDALPAGGADANAVAVVDAVLDEYIAMKRTVPGFARVDFGIPAPGEPDEEHPNHLVADRICGLLAAPLGRSADEALRRKVLVGVEATDALLQLAFRVDPSGDPALIAETRALLHAYLAPSLG
ncbi:TetR family transcriptional regulator [Streptomyces sp. NPDC094032]|uniref:TetR family transcriptional regulator n=1 Tax=Streptomyces sp. NPDC094032 TaxID=3155308 RepID=UPI00332EBD72